MMVEMPEVVAFDVRKANVVTQKTGALMDALVAAFYDREDMPDKSEVESKALLLAPIIGRECDVDNAVTYSIAYMRIQRRVYPVVENFREP